MSSVKRKLVEIQQRVDWLEDCIAKRKANGEPFEAHAREREALTWALSILVPIVENRMRRYTTHDSRRAAPLGRY